MTVCGRCRVRLSCPDRSWFSTLAHVRHLNSFFQNISKFCRNFGSTESFQSFFIKSLVVSSGEHDQMSVFCTRYINEVLFKKKKNLKSWKQRSLKSSSFFAPEEGVKQENNHRREGKGGEGVVCRPLRGLVPLKGGMLNEWRRGRARCVFGWVRGEAMAAGSQDGGEQRF